MREGKSRSVTPPRQGVELGRRHGHGSMEGPRLSADGAGVGRQERAVGELWAVGLGSCRSRAGTLWERASEGGGRVGMRSSTERFGPGQ